jgi:hypothetical protein
VSNDEKTTSKSKTILNWWETIEQQSIELALEYSYVLHTDITNCYGAIYTHSIPWAIHKKEEAKKKENRRDKKLIGNAIDTTIQGMRYGQTNGIPQGSTLMDFIAEIVLGYADELLSEEIKEVKDYTILRYRDDYRIFTNNPEDGKKIAKQLSAVLAELGMHLNTRKTISSTEVIQSSIKADKLYWLAEQQSLKGLSLQKQLLLIHDFSLKYPNAGQLMRALSEFNEKLEKRNALKGAGALAMISIYTDIAFHNPKVYPLYARGLSILLGIYEKETIKTLAQAFSEGTNLEKDFEALEYTIKEQKEKLEIIISKIKEKFKRVPNTGELDIWLQRVTLPIMPEEGYDEKLCQIAKHGKERIDSADDFKEKASGDTLWNSSEWLDEGLHNIIKTTPILLKEKIENMPRRIKKGEVDAFSQRYNS